MRQVNNLGTAFIDDAESTFLPHCSCEWKGTVPIEYCKDEVNIPNVLLL
jgi:hypothetical protein